MHRWIIAAAIAAFACSVQAAEPAKSAAPKPTCSDLTDAKKLSGAARTSFKKKCRGDIRNACSAEAEIKKLTGAALTSFMAKCMKPAE